MGQVLAFPTEVAAKPAKTSFLTLEEATAAGMAFSERCKGMSQDEKNLEAWRRMEAMADLFPEAYAWLGFRTKL